MKQILLMSAIFLATMTVLKAEGMELLETGDPQEGLIYVEEVCANCHAISSGQSPELGSGQRWSRLSAQSFRVDKWSVCRG